MEPTPSIPALQLFDLTGKNVLLTGGTRGTPRIASPMMGGTECTFTDLRRPRSPAGIGAACALALAQAGASICLAQRPASAAASPPNNETRDAIQALGATVKIVDCDLADLEDVKGLFQRALDAMGGQIHVLVNCAGIQRRAPSVEFPEKDWDDVRPLPSPIQSEGSVAPEREIYVHAGGSKRLDFASGCAGSATDNSLPSASPMAGVFRTSASIAESACRRTELCAC